MRDLNLQALRDLLAKPESGNRAHDQRKPNLANTAADRRNVTDECAAGRCGNCWDDDCACPACGHPGPKTS